MGTRGPAPQPTALKKAKGYPGKRPLNRDEPTPKIEAPKPPGHLSRFAKREWKRISPLLVQYGLLSRLDRSALAMYCQAYGRWKKAEKELKDDGEVVVSHHAQSYQSPWLSIANKAMDQMNKAIAEFGLSPSARTRIDVSLSDVEGTSEKEQAVRDILEQMDKAGAKMRTRSNA